MTKYHLKWLNYGIMPFSHHVGNKSQVHFHLLEFAAISISKSGESFILFPNFKTNGKDFGI